MRGPFFVILFLIPNFSISQKIHCWFTSGIECSIDPKFIRFDNGDVLPIESMKVPDENTGDITEYQFVTRNFRYWFCRYNGKLYMVVSPKNPIWVGINDERNRKYVINKFTIKR